MARQKRGRRGYQTLAMTHALFKHALKSVPKTPDGHLFVGHKGRFLCNHPIEAACQVVRADLMLRRYWRR